jgi:L-ascorbate metabolism protein UlaG (beta-lactamase superfamily)
LYGLNGETKITRTNYRDCITKFREINHFDRDIIPIRTFNADMHDRRHDGHPIRHYSVILGVFGSRPAMLRFLTVVVGLLGPMIVPALAQDVPRSSECLAMSEAQPSATPVSLRVAAAKTDQVAITYAGHSTYYIDTPGGVRIATDYNGVYKTGRLPDVVTMNRAHSTHYTLFPDPRIQHVLHGWNDDGTPARISERIGDVFIRNVTTDIRRYFGDDSSAEMIKDGNSIFIFEVAGLCIGHLGHLHHKLDESHFAAIGRLDIVMVPIDGTYTMSLDGISDITRRLRASVVLPMHRFMTPLDEFMRRIGQQFAIDERTERTLTISRDSLPGTPTVIILQGV